MNVRLIRSVDYYQAIKYAQEKFHLYQPGDLPEEEILAQVDGICEPHWRARLPPRSSDIDRVQYSGKED